MSKNPTRITSLKNNTEFLMLGRTAKTLIASVTAFSIAVALVVSVFAQSHPAEAAPTQSHTAAPCAGHEASASADFWSEACDSLCEASDLHTVLAVSSDRSVAPDLIAILLSYDEPGDPQPAPLRFAGRVTSHDPPGSELYLTTRRLRL